MMGRLLACLMLISAGWAAQADSLDPLSLLQKMAHAGQNLTYQGSFTYEHRNAMESFRVYRWTDQGHVHERLEYLNGPAGAAQQRGGPEGCQNTGYRLLSATVAPETVGRLDRYYQLTVRGTDRIAGREALTLEVRPRDQLRYGYLLGIDRDTGLLLKALLVDEQQRLLERFQFVDLDLNPDSESLREKTEVLPEEGSRCTDIHGGEPTRWTLNWLPPGFAYSGEKRLPNGIDMLMYTDGLASFSVFLQPMANEPGIEGRAQRGATSAYMGQLAVDNQPYRVTVVGEIPGNVAEQLARGISVLPTSGEAGPQAKATQSPQR